MDTDPRVEQIMAVIKANVVHIALRAPIRQAIEDALREAEIAVLEQAECSGVHLDGHATGLRCSPKHEIETVCATHRLIRERSREGVQP